MKLAWWFESLWRGAIVALVGFALLVAYGLAAEAWRHRKSLWPRFKNHVWYRFPFAQRRLVRHWQATRPWAKWGKAEWAARMLRTIDRASNGRRHRYRVLTKYLEPLARGEGSNAAS